MFFLAFSFLFGIVSLLLIFLTSAIIGYLTVKGPIDIMDVMFNQKWYWLMIAGFLSPVYLIFILKYFEASGKRKNRVYQMKMLFRAIDTKTFLFFLVGMIGLTLLYTLFFFNDLGLKGFADTDLEMLLNTMGADGNYSIKSWLDNLLLFVLEMIPLLFIMVFGMTLNKKYTWKNIWSNRRSFLVFVFLYFILFEVDEMLWDLSVQLIVNFIGIPFAQNAIPIFFSLLIRLFLTSIFTALLSYFAYYSLQLAKEKKTLKNLEHSERSDLLDDTF